MKPIHASDYQLRRQPGRGISVTVPLEGAALPLAWNVIEVLVKDFRAEVTDLDLEPAGTRGIFMLRLPASHR